MKKTFFLPALLTALYMSQAVANTGVVQANTQPEPQTTQTPGTAVNPNIGSGDIVLPRSEQGQGMQSETPLDCPPSYTMDALEEWRDGAVKKAISGQYSSVNAALKSCFPDGAPKCTNELSYYLQSRRLAYTTQNESNEHRFYGTEKVPVEGLALKSEKDLPPEFLAKDSGGKIKDGFINFPPELLKVAKEKGWKALGYKTRGTGGFDNAPNLSIVAIPGQDKDVYLQISPHPDRNHTDTKDDPIPVSKDLSNGQGTLTVITVDKTQTPPVGQLRLLRYDEIAKAYKWSNNTTTQSCTECHTTPLRSISPRGYMVTNGSEKRMQPEDEKTVTEINDMMLVPGLSWGKLKTNSGVEVRRGPDPSSQPFGWAPPGGRTRKEDFLKNCAKMESEQHVTSLDRDYIFNVRATGDEKNLNHRKVGQAMNCTQCHNGTARGYLHSGFSFDEIKFKVMVDRSMPPGQNLTMDERIALVNCLRAEYNAGREEWRNNGSWMKKEECQEMKAPTSVPASGTGNGSPEKSTNNPGTR